MLNGSGTFNGIPTAYATGTGTVKEYRGQNLAGTISTHSIPFLREAGIRQYLLEVLQNNEKAIAVYRRMNFEVVRKFNCFRQTIKQVDLLQTNKDCMVKLVDTEAVRLTQQACDFSSFLRGKTASNPLKDELQN